MPNSEGEAGRAKRFGIGEWYGESFVSLTLAQRRQLAETALSHDGQTAMPCPFKASEGFSRCTKKGGVCSLRLYDDMGDGTGQPATGDQGDLRAVCPHRFSQDGTIYRAIGEKILGTSQPRIVSEVGFLRRPTDIASDQRPQVRADQEDVGKIDNVLVHPDAEPMRWCALEIQAVYFSGRGMASLFQAVRDHDTDAVPFPDAIRRPDYRSSGPKRLMPQLQTKVPTLRRWGKKMAVVVDAGFFRSLRSMETVADLSSCDIAWFVATYDEDHGPAQLVLEECHLQTLERAVEGLTGGHPVSLTDFEAKIREKLRAGP